MGDEKSEELLTILVAKEKTTRMLMSTVVQACSKESACFSSGDWVRARCNDCQIR